NRRRIKYSSRDCLCDDFHIIYGCHYLRANDCNRRGNRKIFSCYGNTYFKRIPSNAYVCKNYWHCFIRDYSSGDYCYWWIFSNTPKLEDIKSGLFAELGLESISPTLFIYALIFFLLGYLLYATIAAMFGSLVSRVEDLQQLLMPMFILIIIGF